MGGTFDPIHHGHLVAASEASYSFDLDRVIFVPTGQPWQKHDSTVSCASDRYAMTVLACEFDSRFVVSRVDIDRDGPTYTADTLADLRSELCDEFGDDLTLYFITGADALSQIMSWRDHERVLALAQLVGVTRPGYELGDPGLSGTAFTLLEIPALAISSSDIRARVASGHPIAYLVPQAVADYIDERGLYRLANSE